MSSLDFDEVKPEPPAEPFIKIPRHRMELALKPMTHFEPLSSYDWIDDPEPTIFIPGTPPDWTLSSAPGKQVENTAKTPARKANTLEALFQALYTTKPSFDIASVDIVTDRNILAKLLAFVSGDDPSATIPPFAVEMVCGTALFYEETGDSDCEPSSEVEWKDRFKKDFTSANVERSAGHHNRIVSYTLEDLKLAVRYELDGCKGRNEHFIVSGDKDQVASDKSGLRVTKTTANNPPIRQHSTIEMIVRRLGRPIDLARVLPQMWLSQTQRLACAYHGDDQFEDYEEQDVTDALREWEVDHRADIERLVWMLKRIVYSIKKEGYTRALVTTKNTKFLYICKQKEGKALLPEYMYSRLSSRDVRGQFADLSILGKDGMFLN